MTESYQVNYLVASGCLKSVRSMIADLIFIKHFLIILIMILSSRFSLLIPFIRTAYDSKVENNELLCAMPRKEDQTEPRERKEERWRKTWNSIPRLCECRSSGAEEEKIIKNPRRDIDEEERRWVSWGKWDGESKIHTWNSLHSYTCP